MNTTFFKSNPYVVAAITILLLVVLRLVPHWPNWTPVLAFAGFIGYASTDRKISLAQLFIAMLISDAILGFHAGMIAVYGSLALICLLSFQFLRQERRALRTTAIVIVAPLIFFLITNLFVWIQDGLYPNTIEGLWMTYVAALPFLSGTVASTALSLAVFETHHALAIRFQISAQEKSV